MARSKAEELFEVQWKQYGNIEDCDMPRLAAEHKFHPTRKWRFDFAHLPSKTAIEIDGGVWNRQKRGHTSGVGYTADREKDIAAALLGWQVLRFTPQMIDDDPLGCIGSMLGVIEIRCFEDLEGIV